MSAHRLQMNMLAQELLILRLDAIEQASEVRSDLLMLHMELEYLPDSILELETFLFLQVALLLFNCAENEVAS